MQNKDKQSEDTPNDDELPTDQLIRQRFDSWQAANDGIDLSAGLTYDQFKVFLKTKMEQSFGEDEQFEEVCKGLDPEGTGLI